NDDESAKNLLDALEADRRYGRVGDVAHHQRGKDGHQTAKDRLPGEIAERFAIGEQNHRLVVERGLAEPVVTGQREPRRGTRKTMKVRFLATGLFDVEPRESHDGARGEDEGEQPFPSAAV